MKAHQVKAPATNEVTGQKCCECGVVLKAPWGRVDNGKKWVCSVVCDQRHKQGGYNVSVQTVRSVRPMA